MSTAGLNPSPGAPEPEAPAVGTCVRQTSTNKVGRVMGTPWGTRVPLRPLDGGIEWDAEINDLEPMPTGEALRVAIAQVNSDRLGGL